MLKLVQEKSSKGVTLIEDDVHASGLPLLCNFIKHYSMKNLKVHFCLYEHHPSEIESLPFFTKENIVLHDFYTNLSAWNENCAMLNTVFQNLSCVLDNYSSSDCVIILDSLNPILRNFTSQKSLWMLHDLVSSATVFNIVALFHSHLLSESTCSLLKHSANVILSVTSEQNKQLELSISNNTGSKEKYICSITHKKQNGKVVTSDEEFLISQKTFDISTTPWFCHTKSQTVQQISTSQTMDDSGVTFNLNLSKEEDDQRKNLVMPYAKLQIKESTEENKSGGNIFYEADEADLYEDDPDDDLDI